jgi:hypothetical protein
VGLFLPFGFGLYTYIPTISLLDKLWEEGFQPFYACQTKVRDEGKRGHTRHMLRLRRDGFGQHDEVPEIILLNSHDGSNSYQMIPGVFRFVCNNGLVCGGTFGEVRVPHKGDVVGQVIEGAYEGSVWISIIPLTTIAYECIRRAQFLKKLPHGVMTNQAISVIIQITGSKDGTRCVL